MKILALLLMIISTNIYAVDVKTYIPLQAPQYFDTIKKEVKLIMPDFQYPYYFSALIEQESCISLTHSKCWNPKSKLDTKRELGVGLGQITKAYDSKGKVRFDTLTDLRRKYSSYLHELSWSSIEQRPDLQIRSIILLSKDNYNQYYAVKGEMSRIAFMDSAYNGGAGNLNKERRACGLKAKCNPAVWFGNVEKVCLRGSKVLYGNRTACMINREHVLNTLILRMPKYVKAMA
jgi:hypothetical protein